MSNALTEELTLPTSSYTEYDSLSPLPSPGQFIRPAIVSSPARGAEAELVLDTRSRSPESRVIVSDHRPVSSPSTSNGVHSLERRQPLITPQGNGEPRQVVYAQRNGEPRQVVYPQGNGEPRQAYLHPRHTATVSPRNYRILTPGAAQGGSPTGDYRVLPSGQVVKVVPRGVVPVYQSSARPAQVKRTKKKDRAQKKNYKRHLELTTREQRGRPGGPSRAPSGWTGLAPIDKTTY